MTTRTTLKSFLPATLFGRALLILVLPVILIQLVAIYMFFERHWDSIVRNMSSTLAGEVMLLVTEFELQAKEERMKHTVRLGDMIGIGVDFDESKTSVFVEGKGANTYPEFYKLVDAQLGRPFMIRRSGTDRDIIISILMPDGTLNLSMTKKRLVSSTTYIFILWMVGSALILMVIAILFLRNQIRPIRQLAIAAERFGKGQDIPDYSPRGAAEVRQAGRAFMVMRDRIARQVTTRTDMLAAISHDLRTPLTRLRLELAMLGLDASRRQELESDIEEMEHMIQEYLDFARGEGQEESEPVKIDSYIAEIIESYQRHEQPVTYERLAVLDMPVRLRPNAMRRGLQNLIDNALRYGDTAHVSVTQTVRQLEIVIEDSGPGIPEDKQETVFRPFTRLDPSRNMRTGGAGLGLSIARDIVYAHGGTIALSNRPKGGLRVVIQIPV